MRHLAIHLAIALATFMIGRTTTLLPLRSKPESTPIKAAISLAAYEDEIQRIVFRNQIGEPPFKREAIYYLSVYNYEDPPDQTMAYLATLNFDVQKLSELKHDYKTYRRDQIFVRVGRSTWISDTEVMVGSSVTTNWNWTRSYIHRFSHEAGEWKWISSETLN
jgi:hypothetical protein